MVSLFSVYLLSSAVYSDLKELITHDKEEQIIAQNEQADNQISELRSQLDTIQQDNIREEYERQIEDLEESKEDRLASLDQPLVSGFTKFMLLLILEIVIYHFSVQTNNILKNEKEILRYKDFLGAEIRMFFVMARSALFYGIAWVILNIILSVIGLSSLLHEPLVYVIHAFYLGFAFIDNYLEQYNISINNSAIINRNHLGAALVIGLLSSVLLFVPVIGPLFVPIICSIAATRYAHAHHLENLALSRAARKVV